MIVPLSHFEWQVLRCLVRAEAAREAPPLGRSLRLVPTRTTKDGTFIDRLVAAGLIEVAAKATPPAADDADEPPQFRARYRLTARGREAAEYGEYDRPFTPGEKALTGLAADLAAAAGARSFAPGKPAPRRAKK